MVQGEMEVVKGDIVVVCAFWHSGVLNLSSSSSSSSSTSTSSSSSSSLFPYSDDQINQYLRNREKLALKSKNYVKLLPTFHPIHKLKKDFHFNSFCYNYSSGSSVCEEKERCLYCTIDSSCGFFVLHPDMLISSTSLSQSYNMNCPRYLVLSHLVQVFFFVFIFIEVILVRKMVIHL
jgi:hypothetical protein